jgi:hypothetical protein
VTSDGGTSVGAVAQPHNNALASSVIAKARIEIMEAHLTCKGIEPSIGAD